MTLWSLRWTDVVYGMTILVKRLLLLCRGGNCIVWWEGCGGGLSATHHVVWLRHYGQWGWAVWTAWHWWTQQVWGQLYICKTSQSDQKAIVPYLLSADAKMYCSHYHLHMCHREGNMTPISAQAAHDWAEKHFEAIATNTSRDMWWITPISAQAAHGWAEKHFQANRCKCCKVALDKAAGTSLLCFVMH